MGTCHFVTHNNKREDGLMEKKFESFETVTVDVISTFDEIDVENTSEQILSKASCDPPCQ